MSWLGNCTRCGKPTLSTKNPGYRQSDYIGDGFGVRHVWCPVGRVPAEHPAQQLNEDLLWQKHEFIWGRGCGQEDCSESCYEFGSHLSYAEEARAKGFDYCPDFDDQVYQRWLVSVFSPTQPIVQAPLPASASPIEQRFWEAHQRLNLPEMNGLVFQHPVGRYRLDFALPDNRIGIELDGFRNHSKTADIARDRQRQRELEVAGWYLIRFGGSEVHHDADTCVRQAAYLITARTRVSHD